MKIDIKQKLLSLKAYWKSPPKGRYMSFREIAAVSVGGMGVRFITDTICRMILSVGNVLIGNTIGIPPMPLYVIYLLSVLSNIPLTTLRAKIVDYSHNKKGKYRPFIMYMAIPTAILGSGFVMMPYDKMTMTTKCVVILAYNIGFQFFFNFLNDSNDNLVNVLSPNTYERSDVFSIKSIVDSLAPSIMNVIVPIVAQLVTGKETIYDMRVYRVLYPPVLFVGVLLTIFIYVGTEEKIVQPKNHAVKVRFIDTLRSVAKNKYFWIISLASCLGFLETSFANVLGWMYNYQKVCTAAQYALIVTVFGNASLWAMIFTPVLIRKTGKKNLLVFSNILNIFFIAIMYPIVKNAPTSSMIWIFLVCLFFNGVVTQITVTLTPSLNGDIRDYQQYISDERYDGIFAVVGLIGSIWNLATGSILPMIYSKAGLNSETAVRLGYSKNNIYDVLYNEAYFRNICGVLIIASVIGATLNVIPFFFYDLTETKQKAMISVLKIRAMFDNINDGIFEDEKITECLDIIDEAFALKDEKKAETKGLRYKQKKEAKLYNEKIEIAKFIANEIEYYQSESAEFFVERAEKIVSGGIENIYKNLNCNLKQAKALPKNTAEQKTFRKKVIEIAVNERIALKTISKYYPDSIEVFDKSQFDVLFDKEDKVDNELRLAYQRKDKQSIEFLKVEKRKIRIEIKKLNKEFSLFNRAVKPYYDAQKLLKRKSDYENIDDFRNMCKEKLSSNEV